MRLTGIIEMEKYLLWSDTNRFKYTSAIQKEWGEFAVVLPWVEWIYCLIILLHHLRHFRPEPKKYSKAPWWMVNPWPCCGNLQNEPPNSIFKIRRLHFGGAFATTKPRIAAENIGDWGRSLKYWCPECRPQSPIFSTAIRDSIVARTPPKQRRRSQKNELGSHY